MSRSVTYIALWFEVGDRDNGKMFPAFLFISFSLSFSIFIGFLIFEIVSGLQKNANANQCARLVSPRR